MEVQEREREGRGKVDYMRKYFHKGAFFADDAQAAGLLQRDIMGARIQDDVRNRAALPEYLQKRDMTRLGRKGGSKYKDLRSEDTGRWGDFGDARGGRGRFVDVDDERFRPDEGGGGRAGEYGANGANAMPLGRRREDGDAQRRKRSSSRERDDGDKRRRVDGT